MSGKFMEEIPSKVPELQLDNCPWNRCLLLMCLAMYQGLYMEHGDTINHNNPEQNDLHLYETVIKM